MKVVFMGTPDFAVTSLRALLTAGHEVSTVFTRADTPKNRGMKLLPPPVKVAALEAGIPVYQPRTLRDGESFRILQEIAPDVIVVAAYGRILPAAILELPRYGCINVHASLLPAYRGASPINAAILHGETETGVTIMQMNEGLDTGDILLTARTDIGPDESFGALQERLAGIGAQALLDALNGLEQGRLTPRKQDDTKASYAPLIKNQDAQVSFAGSARQIACAIRAYDPAPGAFAWLGQEKLKLFGAQAEDSDEGCALPGTIVSVSADDMVVQCQNGRVRIAAVQGAGGKKMPADAFFRGHASLREQRFQ